MQTFSLCFSVSPFSPVGSKTRTLSTLTPQKTSDYFLKIKSYVFWNAILNRSSHGVFFNCLALEHFIDVIFTGFLKIQHEVDSTVRAPLN